MRHIHSKGYISQALHALANGARPGRSNHRCTGVPSDALEGAAKRYVEDSWVYRWIPRDAQPFA